MARLRQLVETTKNRKLVQWAIAYLAGAWAFAQAFELVGAQFDWPIRVRQATTILLGVGFFAALVIAWYHGEKGRQRVSGAELIGLALLFGIAGLLVARLDARETGDAQVPTTSVASLDARERPAVAVLPFTNLSDDPQDAFFADGIHDEIIVRLSRVSGIDVIARTSVLRYRDRGLSAAEIARELNVGALLEGTVRRSGRRVRIVAELISGAEQTTTWSGDWDRELHPDSIFDVQEEIARSVAAALDATLTNDEERRLATHPTHDLEAYATLGVVAHEFEWNWPRAEANFQRALQLRPNYAAAYHWHAVLLSNLGRHEEALDAGRRALALDPLSTVISADVAGIFWAADSADRAIELLDQAIARDVQPPPIIELERAVILLYESRWDRAATSLAAWARSAAFDDPDAMRGLAAAAAGNGSRDDALATLARVELSGAASREDLIPLYALLGDTPSALDGVERAATTRNPWASGWEHCRGTISCATSPVSEPYSRRLDCRTARRRYTMGLQPPRASARTSAFNRTFAPFSISAGELNSRGEWLMPLALGTKIMPIGASKAISCASWPAPLGNSIVASPSSRDTAAIVSRIPASVLAGSVR